jgi:hypothetical protein
MPVTAIDHILLAMPAGREAEARAFYGDLLGIPEMPKPASLAKRGGCWFESGSLRIHLASKRTSGRPERPIRPSSLTI